MIENLKVVLESENIIYVVISEYLVEEYLKMINDINIQNKITCDVKTYTKEDELKWIKDELKSGEIQLSMIDKKTNKFIGNISLFHINKEEKTAELGIIITSDMQDKHYGTEAIKTMINYGFNDLNLNSVYLVVYSTNEKAINCYKKIGFRKYKEEKNVAIIDGMTVDDIFMKIEK